MTTMKMDAFRSAFTGFVMDPEARSGLGAVAALAACVSTNNAKALAIIESAAIPETALGSSAATEA